jgi:hypothetical protein
MKRYEEDFEICMQGRAIVQLLATGFSSVAEWKNHLANFERHIASLREKRW